MTTPITTIPELEALPEQTVIRDRFGDVGIVQAGYVHYPETDPTSFGKVLRWEPLTVLWPLPEPTVHGPERIDGHWLVEDVKEHTCGAGPGSGAGHEPDCGTIPLIDLRGLDGWDMLVADVLADAPTVKPGRDEVAQAIAEANEWPWDLLTTPGYDNDALARTYLQADAVLAILPGQSEAEVRAGALRDAARAWLGTSQTFLGNDPAAWLNRRADEEAGK